MSAYFDKNDPSHPRRLSVAQNNEIRYMASILRFQRELQEWTQGGRYVTSTGCYVLIEDLKILLLEKHLPIYLAPTDKTMTLVDVTSMPKNTQNLVATRAQALLPHA